MKPSIAILGAGPGGIAAAYRLKRAGFTDITIFERSDGFGGVWRQNTYPGLTCDVMSHFYSFSFRINKEWTYPYSERAEILAYLERVADETGIRPYLRAGITITGLEWDEASASWTIRSSSGEEYHANVVVCALGLFNEPKFADISGRENFEGTQFHSMYWNHDHDLAGERVAVIGTGASAIQFVPRIAPEVAQLTVYQRQPGWINPRVDEPYSERRRWVFRHVPFAARLFRWRLWYLLEKNAMIYPGSERHQLRTQIALEFLEKSVSDPELRTKLTPDYAFGCKRNLPTNAWFPALQRPNVELVAEPIASIDRNAVVTADGVKREIDTLIWGTGFTAARYLSAVDVVGRDGVRLHDEWDADGVRAYLGMTYPGMPNFFMFYGPNTNGTTSVIHVVEAQARYLTNIVSHMVRRGYRSVDPRRRVVDRYDDEIQRRLEGSIWDAGCVNYFKDEQGKIRTQFPYHFRRYWLMTWRVRRGDYRWRR